MVGKYVLLIVLSSGLEIFPGGTARIYRSNNGILLVNLLMFMFHGLILSRLH